MPPLRAADGRVFPHSEPSVDVTEARNALGSYRSAKTLVFTGSLWVQRYGATPGRRHAGSARQATSTNPVAAIQAPNPTASRAASMPVQTQSHSTSSGSATPENRGPLRNPAQSSGGTSSGTWPTTGYAGEQVIAIPRPARSAPGPRRGSRPGGEQRVGPDVRPASATVRNRTRVPAANLTSCHQEDEQPQDGYPAARQGMARIAGTADAPVAGRRAVRAPGMPGRWGACLTATPHRPHVLRRPGTDRA